MFTRLLDLGPWSPVCLLQDLLACLLTCLILAPGRLLDLGPWSPAWLVACLLTCLILVPARLFVCLSDWWHACLPLACCLYACLLDFLLTRLLD